MYTLWWRGSAIEVEPAAQSGHSSSYVSIPGPSDPKARGGRDAALRTCHFGSMPACLMMRPHLSTSLLRRASSTAGVARSCSTGAMLSSAKRLTKGGSLRALCRASTSASTIGLGVLRGAYIPYQVVTSNFGTPASAEVGTFGKVDTRFLPVMA